MLRLFSLNNRIFGTKQILQSIRDKAIIVELKNACSHLGTIKRMARLLQGASVKGGTEQPWPFLSRGTLQQRKRHALWVQQLSGDLKKRLNPKGTTSGLHFSSVENPLLCIRALITSNHNISKGSWLTEVRKVEEGTEKRKKRNAVLKSRFCRIAETDHLRVM